MQFGYECPSAIHGAGLGMAEERFSRRGAAPTGRLRRSLIDVGAPPRGEAFSGEPGGMTAVRGGAPLLREDCGVL